MAATNPNGEQKYWINGTPFEGIQNDSLDTGGQKYWINGTPDESLYPAGIVTPSASISPSASESVSISPSASESASLSPSASESKSISPSTSISPSASESKSISPSSSESKSISPSTSISPSASESKSISPSASESKSISPSTSTSPSASESKSLSPSASESKSISPSASASPMATIYTRGNYAVLPSDDADLENEYTAEEMTNIANLDALFVDQPGAGEYMIHQYKDDAGVDGSRHVIWVGKSSLAPGDSIVKLQIYNRLTTTWDDLITNNVSPADTPFTLTKHILDLTPYKDVWNVISCRVWQQVL